MARHKHDLKKFDLEEFNKSPGLKVLDLFSCSGIAAEGLIKAGCNVVGVDNIKPSYYPSMFIQSDVQELDLTFVQLFDFVWCSPPCQSNSVTWKLSGHKVKHESCLADLCRDILTSTRVRGIIENVEGAKIRPDFKLCGSMFGLETQRHRLFECVNWVPFYSPLSCDHSRFKNGSHTIAGSFKGSKHDAANSLGCYPCRTRHELAQGIPPKYSKFIIDVFKFSCLGQQLTSAQLTTM